MKNNIKKMLVAILAFSLLFNLNYMKEAIFASDINKGLVEATFETINNEEKTQAGIAMNLTYDEANVKVDKIINPDQEEIITPLTYHVTENGSYDFEVQYTNLITQEAETETFTCEVKDLGIEKVEPKGSTGDKTYIANWKAITYTVTFNTNGGTPAIDDQTIEYGGKVTQPASLTNSGYTFAGWYENLSDTKSWNFATDTVTKNTTLFAKWITNNRTVKFNTNGGTPAVGDSTLQAGSKIPKPIDITKSDHTFDGWFTDAAYTERWDFDNDTVTTDVTLYAKWRKVAKNPIAALMFWNEDTKTHLSPPVYSADQEWQGSKLSWGKRADTRYAVKWRILNTNENGYGQRNGILIMNDNVRDLEGTHVQFNSSTSLGSAYSGSNLESVIQDNFTRVLDSKEQGATLSSSRSETNYSTPFADFSDGFTGKSWFAPTMRMMLTESYGYPYTEGSSTSRMLGETFWTSSELLDASAMAGAIGNGGGFAPFSVDVDAIAIVGASQLNPDSILFVSNSIGGKQTGTIGKDALTTVSSSASGEYKLTLKDTTQTITVKSALLDKSNVATIKYDKTGAGTRLSAIITDSNEEKIISYGQLATISSGTLTDQSVAVQLPSDFDEKGYKLKVFTEIDNGDEFTDYASELADTSPTIAKYIVGFNTDGGSSVSNQLIEDGEKLIKPANPTKAGHTFRGWFTDAAGTTEWSFGSDSVIGDMTLYAKWQASPGVTTKADIMLWNDDVKSLLNPPEYTIDQPWVGSKLYWGLQGSTPMKWRILNTDEAGFGQSKGVLIMHDRTTELADNIVAFNSSGAGNAYMGSTLATYLDGKYVDTLDAKEQAATLESSKAKTEYQIPGVTWKYKDEFSQKKWFAPTGRMMLTDSYGYPSSKGTDDQTRILKNSYWLSSAPPDVTNTAANIGSGGELETLSVSLMPRAVSATQLNPNSILFVSKAVDGKKTGANGLTLVENNTDGEYKLTLKDTSQAVTVNSAMVNASNVATIKYDKTGVGTTLSAIITDSNGENVISYGRLVTISSGPLTNQSATVQLPSDFDAKGYKLKVFTEIYNGDMKTDYASELKTVEMSYQLTFDKNTGLGTMNSMSFEKGKSITLPGNTFTKNGFVFNGWNTAADGKGTSYADKATLSNMAASSLTLYATWTVQSPTVFIDIPKGLSLIDNKAEKAAIKEDVVKIVKSPGDINWYPDQDIHIRADTGVTLTNSENAYSYVVEVFKADKTKYADGTKPLAVLNVKDDKKQSSSFTLKTPISFSKPRGIYKGVMNFIIEFASTP